MPSNDNGGCTLGFWEHESSSVINSVTARIHAAMSSAETVSIASMAGDVGLSAVGVCLLAISPIKRISLGDGAEAEAGQ